MYTHMCSVCYIHVEKQNVREAHRIIRENTHGRWFRSRVLFTWSIFSKLDDGDIVEKFFVTQFLQISVSIYLLIIELLNRLHYLVSLNISRIITQLKNILIIKFVYTLHFQFEVFLINRCSILFFFFFLETNITS